MSAKEFHIGDVLSVTTGKLMSPRLIEGVYDILNHMTGESLFTHQLPRVSEEAAPVLIQQHPFLADINLDDVTPENVLDRLNTIIAEHGETLAVEPMSEAQHERIDPLSEAAEMFPPDRIITVRP